VQGLKLEVKTNQEENMEEKRREVQKVVDEHHQMKESNRIDRQHASREKIKLKDQHQKKVALTWQLLKNGSNKSPI